jgi:transmembrane sensor
MQDKDAQKIIDSYNAGTATEVEKALVEGWYVKTADEDVHVNEAHLSALKNEIYQSLPIHTEKAPIKLWPRIAAVASILLILSFGTYFLLHKQPPQQYAQIKVQDIGPGGNKAVLHLANGHKISLSDASNGELNKQGGSSIKKTADGSVVYASKHIDGAMVYDTLTIPCSGTYHLTLSDGSKIWLNATTSIRYPESFSGKERKVELLYGEAYFEVVHDSKMPFRVTNGNQIIEDIGTHFNVSAYENENEIKTTLLEGAVRVSVNGYVKMLKPGQQSIVQSINSPIIIKEANTEEAVAWKNGYFRFNDEKIEPIMRKLSRWYNIDVVYEGPITNEGFYGKISRFRNISGVLNLLKGSKGVHFKVEGRRVTVMQ